MRPFHTPFRARLASAAALLLLNTVGDAWITPKPLLSNRAALYSAPPKKKLENIPSTEQQNQTSAIEQALIRMLEEETPRPLVKETLECPREDENCRFVATSADALWKDPALQLMSSELGVKQLIGEEADDAAVATAILLERTLDTFEDIFVHLRRIPYDKGWWEPPKDLPRRTIVVLGSGWAAHALLKVADCFKVKVIVVSPSNHFVFTPMLASASVGTVEYRSMTEAVRDANPMIENYLEGSAIDVDVENKKVTVQLNSLLKDIEAGDPPIVELDYDHLIVAVGNQVSVAGVPGAAERCLRLKSCDDARRLRQAVGEAFEYASRPGVDEDEQRRRVTFVIIGGGPTGAELAGELSDFCRDITKERVGAYPHLRDKANVVLVHGGDEILQQFEPDLRKEALKNLRRQGVEVILNTRVTEVRQGEVVLSTKVLNENGEPTGAREESILPMGLSVWCAGIAPVPFVGRLLEKLPPTAQGQGGRVNVDRWLRAPMPKPELNGSVLVLGDAASVQSRKKQSFLPQTAQVAGQQGAYVGRLLVRGYDLSVEQPMIRDEQDESMAMSPIKDPAMANWLKFRNIEVAPGFSFLNLGILAYLGGGKALSQVQIGDVPIFSYAGSVAFVLWRSVYLVKQVATRNRVLVTFDWLKSALFGRDTTRL